MSIIQEFIKRKNNRKEQFIKLRISPKRMVFLLGATDGYDMADATNSENTKSSITEKPGFKDIDVDLLYTVKFIELGDFEYA